MQGYRSSSYGDAFADVYDTWYGDISDVDVAVAALAGLAVRGDSAGDVLPILELGVGTGRIALPLAERLRPTVVFGIDSSTKMLDRLTAKQEASCTTNPVVPVLGDMATGLPDGPFAMVFVAFNTFFNLETRDRQQACFNVVAERLAADGCFVIEADVPDEPRRTGSHVEVRNITADRVVLSVARYDGASGSADGQFVEFTESGGVRLRPWSIRYASPLELDAMAATAGLVLRDRWASFAGAAFTDDSDRHVSVYQHA